MAKKNYSNEPYIFKTFQAFAIAYFATYILGNILLTPRAFIIYHLFRINYFIFGIYSHIRR